MPIRSISEYFEKNAVRYRAQNHLHVITAPEVAQTTHTPGRLLAKTVILKADGDLVMAVLPADRKIDFDMLKVAMGAHELRLAKEDEFGDRFPDCEVGGMPPFGNLYDMPVVLEQALTEIPWVAFNAGTHTEIVKMDMSDLVQLTNPMICSFTVLH